MSDGSWNGRDGIPPNGADCGDGLLDEGRRPNPGGIAMATVRYPGLRADFRAPHGAETLLAGGGCALFPGVGLAGGSPARLGS